MSSIFGVFNRDGKTVDKQIVETMLDGSSYWEPDERGTWTDGFIALGHCMRWNTPESKFEHLPLKNDAFVLTMDARIDNRDDLSRELELPDLPMREIGDGEFILAAYKKWGECCPKYLLGDFVFVIWDEKKQQLFCARDHIGIKPFYYHISKNLFIFSNDIRGVIAHKSTPKNYSSKAIAIYLKVAGLLHPTETMFQSIKKLSPACTLIITQHDSKIKSYWRAEESPKIRFNSLVDYANKLRVLLQDAVAVRLRSMYPIGSHLSGGLDSSTIATLAARMLHKENKLLYTYNWVPAPKETDDLTYYEWNNSKQVAENEGMPHHYIHLNEQDVFKIFSTLDIVTNDTTDLWYEFPLREEAKKHNIRTMLSGWGGDELISNNGKGYYTTLFLKGRIYQLLQDFYDLTKRSNHPIKQFTKLCYYQLFLPMIPTSLYCKMPKTTCDDLGEQKLIKPFFISLMNMQTSFWKLSSRTIRSRQIALYHFGHIVGRIESWATSSPHIEYRYPLLDKRIVEFALGIPEEFYYHKSIDRYIFRYSVKDWVPENIRWGIQKAEPLRVERYLEISIKAHQLWAKKRKQTNALHDNPIIDYDYLLTLISNLSGSHSYTENELIQLSDGIGMAIMVLEGGKSMIKYGASMMHEIRIKQSNMEKSSAL